VKVEWETSQCYLKTQLKSIFQRTAGRIRDGKNVSSTQLQAVREKNRQVSDRKMEVGRWGLGGRLVDLPLPDFLLLHWRFCPKKELPNRPGIGLRE
jgi:hypothetical protein